MNELGYILLSVVVGGLILFGVLWGWWETRNRKKQQAEASYAPTFEQVNSLLAKNKIQQALNLLRLSPAPSRKTKYWFVYKFLMVRCYVGADLIPPALSVAAEIEARVKRTDPDIVREVLYDTGIMYEELGMADKALWAFTEIAKYDIAYKDIPTRLKALQSAEANRKREDVPETPPTDAEDLAITGAQTIAAPLAPKSRPEPSVTGAQTIAVKLDRYDIQGEIGRGGMGVVCRAFDRELERAVALKLLPEELNYDPRALISLKKEARIATEMSHPNIVRVYDIGEEGGKRFISMELINGPNLMEALLEKQAFDNDEIRLVARAVCAALGYAHGRRVVHKDIKPANVMVDFGEGTREECIERWKSNGADALRDFTIKVADFGIARTVKDTMTRISGRTTSGTLLYMSPQSLQGGFPTPADDVYSLGCTFYELATGYPPFHTGDITYQHINVKPEDAKLLASGLSTEMNAIIMRCLEKDPAQRFADAGEIAKLL